MFSFGRSIPSEFVQGDMDSPWAFQIQSLGVKGTIEGSLVQVLIHGSSKDDLSIVVLLIGMIDNIFKPVSTPSNRLSQETLSEPCSIILEPATCTT